jgi:hypothetical protein
LTKSKRRAIGAVVVVIGLAAAWMLGVDESEFFEKCPDCGHYEEEFQLRLLTMPVRSTRWADQGTIERLARDLGSPCSHPQLGRWHKHRNWGLLICACPCENGITHLILGSWYTERFAMKARALSCSNPELGAEFKRRVLVGGDLGYYHEFAHSLEMACWIEDAELLIRKVVRRLAETAHAAA